MTLQLVKPEAVVSSAYARWLIYGPNGAGKSTLAATLPKPMMVVSALGENMAPYAGIDGIVINEINDWDQIHETYMLLKGPNNPFKTVVFDTLTRIMGFYLNKLLGVTLSGDEVIRALRVAPSRKASNFNTWLDLGDMSIRTVMLLNQLPLHTVYLCQEETKRPEFDNDIIETLPIVASGNVSWKGVKDIVHMIGRLYVTEAGSGLAAVTTDGNRSINPNRQDKRMLLIGQHDRYFTKGDTETLGYCVENPTWETLSKGLTKPEEANRG